MHTHKHAEAVSRPAGCARDHDGWHVQSCAYPGVNNTSEETISINHLQSRVSVISLYFYDLSTLGGIYFYNIQSVYINIY